MNFQEAYSLEGRRALVTGASRGLGLAIAQCLVEAGAEVIVLGTRSDTVEKACDTIGAKASGVTFDVTDFAGAKPLIDGLFETHGLIDILVNNAGNTVKKKFEETEFEDFAKVLNVHLGGAYALSRAIVPHFLKAGGGNIVFTASMASFLGIPQVIGYSAAKSGYVGMVRSLAVELGGRKIRVNAVAPGWIESDILRNAWKGDPDRKQRVLNRVPTGYVGDPEDIGWAVAYLVSNAARYVNGHILAVDGGGLYAF
ncbi:SDR family NAD(P)-dependent oxidoreductase [Shumkonia mesophila]|uniref:SDR family NAD(P)-dependent oxidoreductase n=1 Tax=Shumkonia mesophila TaxID=2838854 RepID=UPI0029341D32|nr:SDR family NAD(P)-dependent oxidoreductase [Shumkonia mesophila]